MSNAQVDAVQFVSREPCPACGSRDNLARYSDGHGYCFGCTHYDPGADGVQQTRRRDIADGNLLTGEPLALIKRKLDQRTCEKFGYWVGEDRDGSPVQIANYYRGSQIVAQKLRTADKKFTVLGDAKAMGLFGQHLWRDGGKRVVVTEGEIDAMSVAQAFNLSWPAVSVPNGAQGAEKAIRANLEWLSAYEQVVLMFDQDEPGQQAAETCAQLFEPGKCAIARLPLKDASEMIQAGRVKELCVGVYEASTYRPDGIVSLADIEERVLSAPETGRPYPWSHVTDVTYGRRLGEVIGFGGATGCGKTDLMTEMVKYDVVDLEIPTGVIFLEQGVGETGKRIAGKMADRRFHVPDGSWTQDELAKTWGALRDTNRLHLFDNWGACDWETVQSKMRYMVVGLGCQSIYLDHMTALAAAEEDERKALERIMAEAAGMAKGLGFVLHYVSHLATPEGKPHEEGGRVMARHFKGSRALGYWSHYMWGLERNQQAQDPAARHRTVLRCLKDRNTGQATGLTFQMNYNSMTGRLACEGAVTAAFGDDDSEF